MILASNDAEMEEVNSAPKKEKAPALESILRGSLISADVVIEGAYIL